MFFSEYATMVFLSFSCGLRLFLFLKLRFSSTMYSVCVPLSGCRSEYVFLPIMYYRPCYVGIHFAKIIHLFQMSKEMDKIFLSEPKILTFATIFFTLLPLLTLNGSHPMSLSHQHVRPLPLNLLAVFLGKGALLYVVSIYHLALPIFIHLCRLPFNLCS